MQPQGGDLPRVLVAAPTYAGAAYSLEEWAQAYHAFTYPNKGALLVDNSGDVALSDNLHFTHICRAQGIPTIPQLRRYAFLWDTLEISWRTIVEYAHDEGYDLICSIEADVICPPETLDVLVSEWLEQGPKAVVAHRYHPRGIDRPLIPEGAVPDNVKLAEAKKTMWFDTLGCTLFPTELCYATRNYWTAIFEVQLYHDANDAGYKRVRLKDRLEIVHLEDPQRHIVSAYGLPTKPVSDRLHPAEATVKRDPAPNVIERRPEDLPNGCPVDAAWHGRREVAAPEPPVKDPAAAQQARDDLKWNSIVPEKSVEQKLEEAQLMCNVLFAEIERLKGEDRRETKRRELFPGQER